MTVNNMVQNFEQNSGQNLEQQLIPLETAYNLRSLGGYPAKDGSNTSHLFLRGDCVCPMSEGDADILFALGVRTLIDLRGEAERKAIPDTLSFRDEIRYLAIPIIGEGQPSYDNGEFSMDLVYIGILEHSKRMLFDVFMALYDGAQRGRVLFHCTAGKDRTGLVAAMLLSLAGASAQDIVRDYMLTAQLLQPVRELLIVASGMVSYPPSLRDILLGCETASMEKTLAHLQQNYGGVREYMLHIGLHESVCDALVEHMLIENV